MADSVLNTTRLKKRIAFLLGITCLVSLVLILNFTPEVHYQLQNTNQIDSLITQTFEQFNIPADQIRRREIAIDSVLTRSVFTVDLPEEFPKTQWHYELDQQVQPYGVETPAKVIFPERDIHIHLVYGANVVRSVILQTGL